MVISFIWSGRAAPLPNFNPIRIETHRYVGERKLSTVQSPSSFLPAKSLNLKPSQKLTCHQRVKKHFQLLQHIHKYKNQSKKLRIQAHQTHASLEEKPYVPTLPSASRPRRFSMAKSLSVKGLKRMTSRSCKLQRISPSGAFFETASYFATTADLLVTVLDKAIKSTQESKKAMKLSQIYQQEEARTRLAIKNTTLQGQINRARMNDLKGDGSSWRYSLAQDRLNSRKLKYLHHAFFEKKNQQLFFDNCCCLENLSLSDPEIIIPLGAPSLRAWVLDKSGNWIARKQIEVFDSLAIEEPCVIQPFLRNQLELFFRDQEVLGEAFVSMSMSLQKMDFLEAQNEQLAALEENNWFVSHLKKGSDLYEQKTKKTYSQTDFNRLIEELKLIELKS